MEQSKILGWRRFLLSFSGVISYTLIMLYQNVDPFNLGLGLGLLLTPHAVTKFSEALSKK